MTKIKSLLPERFTNPILTEVTTVTKDGDVIDTDEKTKKTSFYKKGSIEAQNKKREIEKIQKRAGIKEAQPNGPKWKTENLTNEFYNFWASLDVAKKMLSDYMDNMNKNKTQDALSSLKDGYDELKWIRRVIDMNINFIKKELENKNIIIKK